MVLACESIFSRTSLDGRPQNLNTFSKVNLKYTECSFPVGQARCNFHLPHSYNLQILLAQGNGASTNVEPWPLNITTGELWYDGPLYSGFLHMTDDMLGPSLMHIKYSSYVYDRFCIWRTNFPGPIESVITKFTCIKVTPWIWQTNI